MQIPDAYRKHLDIIGAEYKEGQIHVTSVEKVDVPEPAGPLLAKALNVLAKHDQLPELNMGLMASDLVKEFTGGN